MNRSTPCITLALIMLATTTLGAADELARTGWSSSQSLEPALSLDLNHSGRDAIILRAEQGDGLVIFLPEPGGGWSRRLFPNMGPKVTAFTAGDLNRDDELDLVLATADGKVATWLGDGAGIFTLKSWVELSTVALTDIAVGDFNGDGIQDAAVASRGSQWLLLPGDGWGEIVRGDETIAASWKPSAALVALPLSHEQAANFRCDGTFIGVIGKAVVYLDRDNEIQLRDCRTGWVKFSLRADFPARALAYGDFNGDGHPDIGVVSGGVRPTLQLFESQGASAASHRELLPSLQFRSIQPEIPNTDFNVSVVAGPAFSPATVNLNTGDRVIWTNLGGLHTATGGTGCVQSTFRRTTNTPLTFSTAGTFPYFCEPHCGLGMLGTVNVAAPASAGTVPDGQTVPGTPLRLVKSGATDLALTWGASCSAGANNYAVYEGTLPMPAVTPYSHAGLNCSLGNVTSATITPTGAGSHYYLIVPRTTTNTGSYGRDSAGTQIPPGTGACPAQALPTSC